MMTKKDRALAGAEFRREWKARQSADAAARRRHTPRPPKALRPGMIRVIVQGPRRDTTTPDPDSQPAQDPEGQPGQ